MLQVIIIEDEKPAADALERLLRQVHQPVEILAVIDSVEDAVSWLRQHRTGLIFLDIHLADGLSFNIFEQISLETPIIFTTAYNQYAIRAFKLNSIDYLLKPIDENELKKALEKFHKLQSQPPVDWQSLIQSFQQKPIFQKRFMVTAGEKIKSIETDEIAYFYAEGRYIFFKTHDNRQYIVDYTLDNLENILDPDCFIRINRQFVVNRKAIKEMFSYPKGRVKIILQPAVKEDVIVSLGKSLEFKNWLNN